MSLQDIFNQRRLSRERCGGRLPCDNYPHKQGEIFLTLASDFTFAVYGEQYQLNVRPDKTITAYNVRGEEIKGWYPVFCNVAELEELGITYS